MTLVVYSDKNLDDIELLIRDKFSSVINKDVVIPSFSEPPAYSSDNLCNFYKVKSIMDEDELNIWFLYPSYEQDLYYEVMQYQTHVLGHEGENSLLSILISEGLATGIVTSYDHMLHAFSYFDISVILTKKGFNQYLKVLEIIWGRINALKATEPQEHVYYEYSNNGRLNWRFLEK